MGGWQPRGFAGLRSLRRLLRLAALWTLPRYPASSLCDNLSLAGPSPLYWSAGGQTREPPGGSTLSLIIPSVLVVSPVSVSGGRPGTILRVFRRRSRFLGVDREHFLIMPGPDRASLCRRAIHTRPHCRPLYAIFPWLALIIHRGQSIPIRILRHCTLSWRGLPLWSLGLSRGVTDCVDLYISRTLFKFAFQFRYDIQKNA